MNDTYSIMLLSEYRYLLYYLSIGEVPICSNSNCKRTLGDSIIPVPHVYVKGLCNPPTKECPVNTIMIKKKRRWRLR